MIIRGFLLRDPAGARTQDPNIKKCCALPAELLNQSFMLSFELRVQR